MSGIDLRQASLSDLDALTKLFDAYRVFYRQPPDEAAARAFLKARFANLESVIFLAEVDDEPAGFTQLYPSFSSVSMRRVFILNDLFVVLDARGQGVAAALLSRAAEFARAAGALRLSLATEIDNKTAQRLYERHGWTREADFYHYSLPL